MNQTSKHHLKTRAKQRYCGIKARKWSECQQIIYLVPDQTIFHPKAFPYPTSPSKDAISLLLRVLHRSDERPIEKSCLGVAYGRTVIAVKE